MPRTSCPSDGTFLFSGTPKQLSVRMIKLSRAYTDEVAAGVHFRPSFVAEFVVWMRQNEENVATLFQFYLSVEALRNHPRLIMVRVYCSLKCSARVFVCLQVWPLRPREGFLSRNRRKSKLKTFSCARSRVSSISIVCMNACNFTAHFLWYLDLWFMFWALCSCSFTN